MICCPKSIKAMAMRITRHNPCDVPLDPLTPFSRILTAGFMELNLSPDVESGEDITTMNAAGEICIRDKDQDRLKGFDVELKLCGISLSIIEMLTDATLLEDAEGNFVGAVMRESKGNPQTDSKALDFWSKNAAKECAEGQITGFNYIHWVLPLTKNWELSGGMNFTVGALELTLSGYAENNPRWTPSLPGSTFPSWEFEGSPSGGNPLGTPSGGPGPVLPEEVTVDPWSLDDQEAIRQGGPLAWRCVGELPGPIEDCEYMPSALASV